MPNYDERPMAQGGMIDRGPSEGMRVTADVGPIEGSLNQLDIELSRLDNQINQLLNKIGPVTNSNVDRPGSDEKMDPSADFSTSEMTTRIRTLITETSKMVYKISNAIDCVEL